MNQVHGPFLYAGPIGCNLSACTGQMMTQTSQLRQSAGRGNHGNGPAMARQSTGHTGTQSPQPVQRVSSSTGRSFIGVDLESPTDRNVCATDTLQPLNKINMVAQTFLSVPRLSRLRPCCGGRNGRSGRLETRG